MTIIIALIIAWFFTGLVSNNDGVVVFTSYSDTFLVFFLIALVGMATQKTDKGFYGTRK